MKFNYFTFQDLNFSLINYFFCKYDKNISLKIFIKKLKLKVINHFIFFIGMYYNLS